MVPAFKDVFTSFGAELPAPTLAVIAISIILLSIGTFIFGSILVVYISFSIVEALSQHTAHDGWDFCKPSVFGPLVRKATIARWTRTLATMFAAVVPLVESLDSVGGIWQCSIPRRNNENSD